VPGTNPLKLISDYITRIADLAEAEGRALKANAAKVGTALAVVLAAAIIGVGAVGLLLAAAWLALSKTLGDIQASLIAGLIALTITGALLWTARRILHR